MGKQLGARVDPVCGRTLAPDSAQSTTDYKRRRYHFCSDRCREQFLRQTERFRLRDLARSGALLTPGRIRWGVA